jgi:4-diphosphocytidyl-2-C-methyl-D-erythritol kinase
MTPDPGRRLGPVVRLAPAKLNLTLAVVGRRTDGYHDLHSVMVPLALADVLTLASVPTGPDTLHVEGHDPGAAADNLVLRALAATRRAVGAGWGGQDGPGGRAAGPGAGPAPSLAARLDKRIPVAAGLGGGSSDAAAALDGALEAWFAELDDRARLEVGASLGSDVPFFLAGGTALVEGRGERVSPLRGVLGEPPGVLLVCPAVALSTREVFAAFADGARSADPGATRASSAHLATELQRGLTGLRLVERAGVLASANDLVVAAGALVPGLTSFRRALIRTLGRPVGQSGSGPTSWALYASREEAAAAAGVVRDAVADGRIPIVGVGPPTIVATTLGTTKADAANVAAGSPPVVTTSATSPIELTDTRRDDR